MKERLLRDVAMLASERFQQRYVVNGTRDEYILPEDILESAMSSASSAIGPMAANWGLSPAELDATRRFMNLLREAARHLPFEDSTISNEELIKRDSSWAAARIAATALLDDFGFSLRQWETEQGLE